MSSAHLRNGVALTFAALFLFVSCLGCGSKAVLKFQPQPGDKRLIKLNETYAIDGVVMGHNASKTCATSLELSIQSGERNSSGEIPLQVTFNKADFGSLAAMTGLLGQTEENENGVLGSDIGLIGKGFTAIVSPLGHVDSTQGMDELVAAAVDKTESDIRNAMKKSEANIDFDAMIHGMHPLIEGQLKQLFGAQAMAEIMDNILGNLPESSIRVGSKWSRVTSRKTGVAPITRAETWKVTDRENGLATFESKSKLSPNNDASPLNLGMIGSLRSSYSGEMKTTTVVEESTGWPVKSDVLTNLSGQVHLKPLGNNEPEIGPISLNIKITMGLESQKE
jgi:hypothetical protein